MLSTVRKPAVAAKSRSGTDSYDLFYLELRYDSPMSGFGTDAPARQDGNISQVIWRVRGHERLTYGYTYDYLSRLTDAHTGTIDESAVLTGSMPAMNTCLVLGPLPQNTQVI